MATCSLVMEMLTEWDMWITSTYGQGLTQALVPCSSAHSLALLWNASTSSPALFAIVGNTVSNMDADQLVPPGLVVTAVQWSTSSFVSEYGHCQRLPSQRRQWDVLTSRPSLVPRLILDVLDSCSHKGGLLPLKVLLWWTICIHLAVPQKSAYGDRYAFHSLFSFSRICTFSYSVTKAQWVPKWP